MRNLTPGRVKRCESRYVGKKHFGRLGVRRSRECGKSARDHEDQEGQQERAGGASGQVRPDSGLEHVRHVECGGAVG